MIFLETLAVMPSSVITLITLQQGSKVSFEVLFFCAFVLFAGHCNLENCNRVLSLALSSVLHQGAGKFGIHNSYFVFKFSAIALFLGVFGG